MADPAIPARHWSALWAAFFFALYSLPLHHPTPFGEVLNVILCGVAVYFALVTVMPHD